MKQLTILFFLEQILRDSHANSFKSIYTHGHENMNHPVAIGVSPSRYSAPPSTSPRSDPKHNPLSLLQSHQLSMLHSAASLPHLSNNSSPPPTSQSSHGPSAANSSSLMPASSFSSVKGQSLPTDNTPTYPHLPKHWVWNSQFFYPHSRPTQEGFQPYLSGNGFGGLFGTSSPSSKSVVDLSQSLPTPATNTTGSDVTSEDSFDPEDARHSYRTPPPSPHTPPQSSRCPQDDHGFNRKKRNPYSIEELLKKPDPKRVRRPSVATTFRPSIIIEDRSRSSSDHREMSPVLIVESSRSGSEDGCYKNEAIEICD